MVCASIKGAVQLASRLGYHGREDEMLHHLDSKLSAKLGGILQLWPKGPLPPSEAKGPLPPSEEPGAAKKNANMHHQGKLITRYIVFIASFVDVSLSGS